MTAVETGLKCQERLRPVLSFVPHCTGAALIIGDDRAQYTGMRLPSSKFATPHRQSRLDFVAFLQTELEFALSLVGATNIARLTARHQAPDQEFLCAEMVYSELARTLANPNNARQLSSKQRRGIVAGMANLKKALNTMTQKRAAVA